MYSKSGGRRQPEVSSRQALRPQEISLCGAVGVGACQMVVESPQMQPMPAIVKFQVIRAVDPASYGSIAEEAPPLPTFFSPISSVAEHNGDARPEMSHILPGDSSDASECDEDRCIRDMGIEDLEDERQRELFDSIVTGDQFLHGTIDGNGGDHPSGKGSTLDARPGNGPLQPDLTAQDHDMIDIPDYESREHDTLRGGSTGDIDGPILCDWYQLIDSSSGVDLGRGNDRTANFPAQKLLIPANPQALSCSPANHADSPTEQSDMDTSYPAAHPTPIGVPDSTSGDRRPSLQDITASSVQESRQGRRGKKQGQKRRPIHPALIAEVRIVDMPTSQIPCGIPGCTKVLDLERLEDSRVHIRSHYTDEERGHAVSCKWAGCQSQAPQTIRNHKFDQGLTRHYDQHHFRIRYRCPGNCTGTRGDGSIYERRFIRSEDLSKHESQNPCEYLQKHPLPRVHARGI